MKKLTKVACSIALFLFLAVICTSNPCIAQGQSCPPYNLAINISPSDPTSQDDIQIIVTGEWGNPGYEIVSHTHSISMTGNKILITATIEQKSGHWIQLISGWNFTEDIGILPAGHYVVEADVNGVIQTTEFDVFYDKLVVSEGESFEIPIEEVLHPDYEWRLKYHDPEYVEYCGYDYDPPPFGIAGITTKVFLFTALKEGSTEIHFVNYEIDQDGNPIKEIGSRKYKIVIL